MKIDYSVNDDGVVHGLPPVMYEYGERYVKCRRCNLSRPGYELKVLTVGEGPICKAHTYEPSRTLSEVR